MFFHDLDRYWSISDGPDGPPDEPVTIAEAKTYCRFESAAFDDDFARWISAARDLIERDSSRCLVPKVGELYLERFPTDFILLERVPATGLDSISYLDGDGDRVTWDSSKYRSDLNREPGIIVPAIGQTWPTAKRIVGSVIVTLDLGYATASDVPHLAKQIILFLVGHWFVNPDSQGLIPKEIAESYQNLVRRLSWGAYP